MSGRAATTTAGALWTHLKYDWMGRVVRKINTDGIDQTTLNDSDVLISYEGCSGFGKRPHPLPQVVLTCGHDF